MRRSGLVLCFVVALSACVGMVASVEQDGGAGGGAAGGQVNGAEGGGSSGGGGATGGGGGSSGGGGSLGGGSTAGGAPDAGPGPGPLTAACSAEPQLAGRSDLVFCEGFERADWWSAPAPWVANARKTPRPLDLAKASHVANTSIETSPGVCRQGSCLRVNTPAGSNLGVSLHWPLKNAGLTPDRLFARYYLKLSPGWTPQNCSPGTQQVVSEGGKFPGLVDVRVNGDPEAPGGQCGNGGADGDGINCWSHRGFFGGCETGNGGKSVCTTKVGAKARFGGYLYHGDGVDNRSFEAAPWDSDYWTQFGGGGCENDPFDLFCTLPASDRGTSAADPKNLLHNDGVLVGDTWYAIEVEIAMNTPGLNNGVIRGWMNGKLVYHKPNMVFRAPGHDGLHVRSFWLDVYHGGVDGACVGNTLWLDQLVLATSAPIGTLP